MSRGNTAMQNIAGIGVYVLAATAGIGIAILSVLMERIGITGIAMAVNGLRAAAIFRAVRVILLFTGRLYHVAAGYVTTRIAVPRTSDKDIIVVTDEAADGKNVTVLNP